MTEIHTIRRRSDGSIDTKLYLNTGLNHRSAVARQMVGRATSKVRKHLAWLVAITAFFLTRGDHAFKNSADDAET